MSSNLFVWWVSSVLLVSEQWLGPPAGHLLLWVDTSFYLYFLQSVETKWGKAEADLRTVGKLEVEVCLKHHSKTAAPG